MALYYPPGAVLSTVDLNDARSVAYDVQEDGTTVVGIKVLEIQMPDASRLWHDLTFPRDLARRSRSGMTMLGSADELNVWHEP